MHQECDGYLIRLDDFPSHRPYCRNRIGRQDIGITSDSFERKGLKFSIQKLHTFHLSFIRPRTPPNAQIPAPHAFRQLCSRHHTMPFITSLFTFTSLLFQHRSIAFALIAFRRYFINICHIRVLLKHHVFRALREFSRVVQGPVPERWVFVGSDCGWTRDGPVHAGAMVGEIVVRGWGERPDLQPESV